MTVIPPSPDELLGVHARRLVTVQEQASGLVKQLQALLPDEPPDRQVAWNDYIGMVQEVLEFAGTGTAPMSQRARLPLTSRQQKRFGRLLRDKRNAAGLSRVQLAGKAKISDATVKFIETARHRPSRATLIRLIGVPELRLSWSDVPGQKEPLAAESSALVGVNKQSARPLPDGLPGDAAETQRSVCRLEVSHVKLTVFADGGINLEITPSPAEQGP